MGWEPASYVLATGIFFFIVVVLQWVVKTIMDGKVKVAEANARAEEAKLEQKKLDNRS